MNRKTNTVSSLGRLSRVAAIGCALAAVAACTAVEDLVIAEKLEGTSWRAVSIDGVSVPQGVDVTMDFAEDKSVSGLAGCNNYNVQKVGTDNGIAFTQVSATRKLCPEPQMTTENMFVDALSRVNNFRRVNERQLQLFGPDASIMLEPAG